MIEILAFIISVAGIALIVGGALAKFVEKESNNLGFTGIALFIVGLVMLYGPQGS